MSWQVIYACKAIGACCVTPGLLLGLMATGTVQLGFIDGVEIDRYGNLNTSTIGDWRRPTVRLPGSGGGVDMAIVRD